MKKKGKGAGRTAGRYWSIRDVLGQTNLHDRIYVVWRGRSVVYVGLAGRQSVATRIGIHLTESTKVRPVSRFARLLQDNHPRYFGWTVQVLTIRQCEMIVGRGLAHLAAAEQAVYDLHNNNQGAIAGNAQRPHG